MPVTISGSNGITSVNGASGTPSITGTDTDTGVFFPEDNTLSMSTNGVERIRINSSGNVGIGTTSPTAKLDVVGDIKTNGASVATTGKAIAMAIVFG